MIEIFTIKTFVISYICFLVFFAVYTYRGDSSRECDEKIILVGFLGALNFSLYLFLTTMRPEIKEMVTQWKSTKSITVESPASSSKNNKIHYVEGYLLENVYWADIMGNIHYNSQETRIEIWKSKIVTANGGEITQIYFLEGKYRGYWGYVGDEEYLLEDDAPLGK